jgi:hypothetical protein
MTVRARPDLPVDPGATSDEEKTVDSMNANTDSRRRLSSDDILFVKEASLSASIAAQKRRRSSRRSTEIYYVSSIRLCCPENRFLFHLGKLAGFYLQNNKLQEFCRSACAFQRAGDSSSQSSTPSEKKTTVRARRIDLRRLSCLPPPKRLVVRHRFIVRQRNAILGLRQHDRSIG